MRLVENSKILPLKGNNVPASNLPDGLLPAGKHNCAASLNLRRLNLDCGLALVLRPCEVSDGYCVASHGFRYQNHRLLALPHLRAGQLLSNFEQSGDVRLSAFGLGYNAPRDAFYNSNCHFGLAHLVESSVKCQNL